MTDLVFAVNFWRIHEGFRSLFNPQPKPAKRVVDKGAIDDYRLKHPFCEYVFPVGDIRQGLKCGSPAAHIHHKKFRSRGGGDVEPNFESLCLEHHDLRHGLVHTMKHNGAQRGNS